MEKGTERKIGECLNVAQGEAQPGPTPFSPLTSSSATVDGDDKTSPCLRGLARDIFPLEPLLPLLPPSRPWPCCHGSWRSAPPWWPPRPRPPPPSSTSPWWRRILPPTHGSQILGIISG